MLLRQILQSEKMFSGSPDTLLRSLQDCFSASCSCSMDTVYPAQSDRTTFVRFLFPGAHGKTAGGSCPTLGVIGQLGGLRISALGPELVSDSDGALAAVALALKLKEMAEAGLRLDGDVIVATHLCTEAHRIRRTPVDFVDMPIPIREMQHIMVSRDMDAVISLDTSKGNRVLSCRGVALTPVAKEGYILPLTESLIDIYEQVTGKPVQLFALATQDITPSGNGLRHVNSIMQPAIETTAPVLGVAFGAQTLVAGTAMNASYYVDLEEAARFCLEAAIRFSKDEELFYDRSAFAALKALYGPMDHLQKD